MKQHPQILRIATVALFASAALVNAPLFGQDAPVVAPPPPVQVAPPPVVTAPPAAAPAPAREPGDEVPAREARQTRAAPRTIERSTRTASRPAPAPVVAPALPAPDAAAPASVSESVAPPGVQPASAEPVQAGGGVSVAEGEDRSLTWLVAAGLALMIAFAGLLFWRRRGAETHGHEEAHEEPALVVQPDARAANEYQPALVTPVFRRAGPVPVAEPEVVAAATGGMALHEPDRADIEALTAASSPEGHRPWLEFLMRPVRAGTTGDEALVEFELTVGNTGTVAAEDVRISTWMLADGQGSEAERALIERPADAATSATRIAPGAGTKVDATIALPRARLRDDVLPVVVADARYRLPGGGEGRTSARFAVGLPSGDGLALFALALDDGLRNDVEARLDGEPEHA